MISVLRFVFFLLDFLKINAPVVGFSARFFYSRGRGLALSLCLGGGVGNSPNQKNSPGGMVRLGID